MPSVIKIVFLGVFCLATACLIGGGVYWHQNRAAKMHQKSLKLHQMNSTASFNTTSPLNSTIPSNSTSPLTSTNTVPNTPLNITTTETNHHLSVESLNPSPSSNDNESSGPKRAKRAIIFRPLFVYRQQEIKKQRLKEERDQRMAQYYSTTTTTTTPRPPQRPKYASYYPYVPNMIH